MVERHLAKVNVAGSNLVSRSKKIRAVFLLKIKKRRRYSQVVRPRSAKPLSPGSNPGGASRQVKNAEKFGVFRTISRCGGIGRRKGLKSICVENFRKFCENLTFLVADVVE